MVSSCMQDSWGKMTTFVFPKLVLKQLCPKCLDSWKKAKTIFGSMLARQLEKSGSRLRLMRI